MLLDLNAVTIINSLKDLILIYNKLIKKSASCYSSIEGT